MKTVLADETAARNALEYASAWLWTTCSVEETAEVRHRQESRGRPGANTAIAAHPPAPPRGVHFSVADYGVAADACFDSCWPLITNDRALSGAEMLVVSKSKYRPSLERCHHILKGDQLVRPVFLDDSGRIEGFMACHFETLLAQALVELVVLRITIERDIKEFPLYPADRACPIPSVA
jgi:hypothetical protein